MIWCSLLTRAMLRSHFPAMWQAIFLTYGKMEPRTADRIAEMLGFDPDLVMPRLRAHAASPAPFAGAEPGAESAGSTA